MASLLLEGADALKAADPVNVAVVWVEKARVGSTQWSDVCTQRQLQAYQLKKQLKNFTMLVKYLLLGLAFIEVPSYCILDKSHCPGGSDRNLHGSGTPMLPLPLTNSLAILMWVYFAFHMWLRKEALGKVHNFTPWHYLGFVLVGIGFLDCVVSIFVPSGLMWGGFRVSRLIRPLVFLSYTKKVREAGERVLRCIPKILDVFLALIICILLFSWVGLLMFGGESEEGMTFFSSWEKAITALYILFTTANCPDVFLPAYEKHHMTFLFFCFFIIITIYLLSNVLLAAVFDAYKEQLTGMLKEYDRCQNEALKHAFDLIADESKVVRLDRWTLFFTRLCDSFAAEGETHGGLEHSDDAKFNRKRSNQVFQIMDTDHSKGMDFEEFKFLLNIIQDSDDYMPKKAPPKIPLTPVMRDLKKVFLHGFDLPGGHNMSCLAFMDIVILIDMLLVLYQTILYVNGSGEFNMSALDQGNVFWLVLFGFSVFYVIVLSLRIWVLGFERFWHMKPIQDRYDFFTIYGIFAAEVLTELIYRDRAPQSALRFVVILHVSRCLRFLRYIHPLKYVANLVVRLAPTYYRMGMLLLTVFYMYAMIGQQWFGGRIYDTNPVLSGTDFAEAKYWSMNFNDFNNSMVTLFVLMVVNNWFVITDALIKVSATRWAALFAVSFFVIVNLIVLNILMALILEMSSVISEEMESEDSGKEVKHFHNYEQMLRRVLSGASHEDDDVERSPSSALMQSQLFEDSALQSAPLAGYGSTQSSQVRRQPSVP